MTKKERYNNHKGESDILNHLSQNQKRAVLHRGGPACVIAGVGTGKTFTLLARLVQLVQTRRVDPGKILVTTFTRKATAELYQKAYDYLGAAGQQVNVMTIDSLISDLAQQAEDDGLIEKCRLIGEAEQRILLLESAWECFGKSQHQKREYWPDDIYRSRPIKFLEKGNPEEYDRERWTEDADSSGLVDLLESMLDVELSKGAEKKKRMHKLKDRLQEKKMAPYLVWNSAVPTWKQLEHSVEAYMRKLEELGVKDHDMRTKEFLELLRRNRSFAREFGRKFDAILVDEFQDTSRIQAEVLIALAGTSKNIWVVGDPCQQIYEWRGAGIENLHWFLRKTKAARYHLTSNRRSTQVILDSAFHFLRGRVPSLKRSGMLKHLKAVRPTSLINVSHPIYTGKIHQALWMVKRILELNPDLKPCDVAVLSRKLDGRTIESITKTAKEYGLRVQINSSRSDLILKRTLVSPTRRRPGQVLPGLYKHLRIRKLVSCSMKERNFGPMRELRSLAVSADATDASLSPKSFTFKEAWPALKKIQDREVAVSSAVVPNIDCVQVMTVHAAKGLEFPVVVMMKLGKSFPQTKDDEEARLAYVGATRARDILILVHTNEIPSKLLSEFGTQCIPIHRNKHYGLSHSVKGPAILNGQPIIAAAALDLYEECPLKFAAYHEGRFVPPWSVAQSVGSRMHKCLEYSLRAGIPKRRDDIEKVFSEGIRNGDSFFRILPRQSKETIREAFFNINSILERETNKVLLIEQRYRHIQGTSGQVDGVIDALIERRDGSIVLKEWKTSSEISSKRMRMYELQARAGALGIAAQNGYKVDFVEIVPVLRPRDLRTFKFDDDFKNSSEQMLDHVFKDLRDRSFEPKRGNHCSDCSLKKFCPPV